MRALVICVVLAAATTCSALDFSSKMNQLHRLPPLRRTLTRFPVVSPVELQEPLELQVKGSFDEVADALMATDRVFMRGLPLLLVSPIIGYTLAHFIMNRT